MTKLGELIAVLRRNGDEWRIVVGDDWLQGRTVYGGLAAALCHEACQLEEKDLPPLRSAQFTFVGPAAGELRLRPTLLRRGKSAVFFRVELSGEPGLATHATFCFAADRSSQLSHDAIAFPSPKAPAECPDLFEGAPRTLNFVQHLDARLAGGHRPFGGGKPEVTAWVRHRDTGAPSSMTSLIALADAPPPSALVLARQPGQISTMTWSIDVLSTNIQTNDGWWLVRASSEMVANGYSSQAMTVWSATGTPVMACRQSLALFL